MSQISGIQSTVVLKTMEMFTLICETIVEVNDVVEIKSRKHRRWCVERRDGEFWIFDLDDFVVVS